MLLVRYVFYICLFCFLMISQLSSQQGLVDSFLIQLNTSPSDSIRMDLLIELANAYKVVSIDSSVAYIGKIRSELDSTLHDDQAIKYKMAESNIYYTNGNISESLSTVQAVLNNKEYQLSFDQYADFSMRQALCHYRLADYQTATDQLLDIIDTLSNKGDKKRMASCYNSLGNIMRYNQRLDQALTYYQQAYDTHIEIGENRAALRNLASMATGQSMLKNFDKSIPLFRRAIEGSITENDPFLEAFVYGNLGLNYVDLDMVDSATYFLKNAVDKYSKMNNKVRLARTSSQLSRLYLSQEQYHKAKDVLLPSLNIANDLKNLELQNAICVNLYKAYDGLGDYKNAFKYARQNSMLTDSILSKEVATQVQDAQTKYETEKKEAEIERLALEDQIKQNRILQQRWALGALVAVISLMGLFFYRLRKQKLIIEQQNEQNKSLLKEIHHRVKNNLQVISSLLKLQSRSVDDKITQQVLLEGQDRVRSMSLIHQNLYQDGNLKGIKMNDYLSQLSSEIIDNYQVAAKTINLQLQLDNIQLDVDSVVPIGLIVNELMTNSIKYAFGQVDQPEIMLRLQLKEDQLHLHYADNGPGFDHSAVGAGSIGMRLIRSFSNRLQAETIWDTDGHTIVNFIIRDFDLVT